MTRSLWIFLFIFFVLRLVLAWSFPMGNDEVYYWDWGRSLAFSYVDAPPLVGWSAFLGGLFFPGAFGARFLFPFYHLFISFFLIQISFLLVRQNASSFWSVLSEQERAARFHKSAFLVLLLLNTIPVFHLEGVFLLPDGPLLWGLSGALYFLVRFFSPAANNSMSFSSVLWQGVGCGVFLGIAGLAKYHALPIAVGFFLASMWIKKEGRSRGHLMAFWSVAVCCALFVCSPVFIWNYVHQWASFRFQSEHGFAGYDFKMLPLLRYLLGAFFYLWPWFFVLFVVWAAKSLRFLKDRSSLSFLGVFPFWILFFLILVSAAGKQALPHWAMPGFFLLIPFIASANLSFFASQGGRRLLAIGMTCSIVLPLLICVPIVQRSALQGLIHATGNADLLSQVFLWKNLEHDLYVQHGLSREKSFALYPNVLRAPRAAECASSAPLWGSFRWYWTAQMAFHFQGQPRVLNFDFYNNSFYQSRDEYKDVKGCPIILVGSEDHFDEKRLNKVVEILRIERVSIEPYPGTKMVWVEGVLK